MGGGIYCSTTRALRAESAGYFTKSSAEVFTQRQINNAMSPHGVKIRESRDSAEHPESLAIIIALDLTGSMGSIPAYLVKNGLPSIMERIMSGGIKHPQVLFVGVGDHECDQAPLQVGQFESSDELLDHWLTTIYIEGNGGGNDGESYLLAWYFAAYHTAIDCWEKRKKKGYLFTIGDEPTLTTLPKSYAQNILGPGQYSDYTASSLLDKASETYNAFHIHLSETRAGSVRRTVDGWKQIMAGNLLVADRHEQVSNLISDAIIKNEGLNISIPASGQQSHLDPSVTKPAEIFL